MIEIGRRGGHQRGAESKTEVHVSRPDDQGAARRRERVLFDLARRDKSDVSETFHAITEATAVALDVARASIWRLLPDGSAIVCEDGFLRKEGSHARGEVLYARDFPSYFAALVESRVITAHDVRADLRTRELRPYLEANAITSMMDVPIWHKGRTFGVLCHEHVGPARRWSIDDESFAANMADLVSLSLEAGERRDAERLWDTVINTLQEAVFVLDSEGQLVQMNPIATQMTEFAGGGHSLEERQRLIEFRDERGTLIPRERTAGSRSLKGEIIRGEIIQTLFKSNGQRRSYRVTTAPIREGERIQRVVAVLADVTEEMYFERLKREVLAALAHEFKTPVAIVKAYSQHLGRIPEVERCAAPMLGAIERASSRL